MTIPSEAPENLKERLKASYDAIAPEYNAWATPQSTKRMHYLEKALALLSQSKSSGSPTFLELGAGAGIPVTQKLLSYPGSKVFANDLSGAQLALARKNLLEGASGDEEERLTLMEGDMTKLSFPEGSIDTVLGFYSIIHLPREEQTGMIRQISGWLKPGGYLLANFSEKAAETVVEEKWLHEKGWMFWSGWGKEENCKIVQEAGLEIVVSEVTHDVVDDSFHWVIAKKKE
ncbi:S-adenosyl-L-methionine-dependent methyltransferase [Xylariaceae sp. FL0016]|nr:S-adenosyl-L-methionine-dependent methyltransferase [Xylariaceae sp. FL0016]